MNDLNSVLIELDVLFDTRLGTIYNINKDIVPDIINNNYHGRTIDSFKGIDDHVFKEAYANRNKLTLKNSIITDIGRLLNEFSLNCLYNNLTTPFVNNPKIIINIHPYKLNEDEIKLIIQAVSHILNRKADIEVIDKSYEELRPVYLNKNVNIIVLYDYWKWLEIHSKDASKNKLCPGVSLIAPRISFHQNIDNINNQDINPFHAAEEIAAPLINLKHIDVTHFCFMVKPFIKKDHLSE